MRRRLNDKGIAKVIKYVNESYEICQCDDGFVLNGKLLDKDLNKFKSINVVVEKLDDDKYKLFTEESPSSAEVKEELTQEPIKREIEKPRVIDTDEYDDESEDLAKKLTPVLSKVFTTKAEFGDMSDKFKNSGLDIDELIKFLQSRKSNKKDKGVSLGSKRVGYET
jgi:hypothetical protein